MTINRLRGHTIASEAKLLSHTIGYFDNADKDKRSYCIHTDVKALREHMERFDHSHSLKPTSNELPQKKELVASVPKKEKEKHKFEVVSVPKKNPIDEEIKKLCQELHRIDLENLSLLEELIDFCKKYKDSLMNKYYNPCIKYEERIAEIVKKKEENATAITEIETKIEELWGKKENGQDQMMEEIHSFQYRLFNRY